jgi:hypothetical protein
MDQHRRRNTKTLWALIPLGIAYSGLVYYQRAITGVKDVDGAIGVLLGLYICSHPAANVVDILFFRGWARLQLSSRGSAVLWLALNILAFLTGWIAIFAGTTRLIGKAD